MPSRPERKRKFAVLLLLFFVLTLVYHSNFRLLAAGDSLPTSLVTISVLTDGTISLDRFGQWLWDNLPYTHGIVTRENGRYYSIYPAAQSVLTAPLLAPAVIGLGVDSWDIPRQVYFSRICEKFVAVFLASVTVIIMFLTFQRLVIGRWQWVLTIVFAFGTSTWAIASQALWQHTTGQMFLAGALYGFVRWTQEQHRIYLLLCGTCAGAALLVRPTNALMICAMAVAVLLGRHGVKTLVWLLAAPFASGVLLVATNLAIYGNPLGGYARFVTPPADPLYAVTSILFSPGRGLFIFSPVLLFAVAGATLPAVWKSRYRLIALTCVLFIVGQTAIVARWPFWWGGHSWGARLLTETGPAMVVLIALAAPSFTRSFVTVALFSVLAGMSVFAQGVGAYCYPRGAWDSYPVSIDVQPGRVWDWTDSPIIRTAKAGLETQPYENLHKLARQETWLLTRGLWRMVPPPLLAIGAWWVVPDTRAFVRVAPEKVRSPQRNASGACFVDSVGVTPVEDSVHREWALTINGWAFDRSSGSAAEDVVIELISTDGKSLFAGAQRYERPDVARAFSNSRVGSAGFVVQAYVDDASAGEYAIRVLQPSVANTVAECRPEGKVVLH